MCVRVPPIYKLSLSKQNKNIKKYYQSKNIIKSWLVAFLKYSQSTLRGSQRGLNTPRVLSHQKHF